MTQIAMAGPNSIDDVCNPHGLLPPESMTEPTDYLQYPQQLQCHMHSGFVFPNHNFNSVRAMSFDLGEAAG